MRRWIHEGERDRAVANIVTGCTIVLFAILVYQFNDVVVFLSRLIRILTPFMLGFVVAFLLNPPQMWLERQCIKVYSHFFKKRTPPKFLFRVLTLVLLYVVFVLLIVGFLTTVLPQLVDSIRQLVETVTRYLNAHSAEIQAFFTELNLNGADGGNSFYNSLMKIWNDFASMSLSYTAQLVVGIVNISATVSSGVSEIIIGLIVSIYMVSGKERFVGQAKKLACAFLPPERVARMAFWFRKSEHIFSGYIVGQILSSVMVGLLCYIFMLICKMEFPLLISVMVGITNIIPFFGPIIGGVIGALILMISNPMNSLVFGIFILILQQIDGNIIMPRIVGDSIGISSFWVMLSIVVGGGLFGVAGILFSIPVFAVVYAVIESIAAERLQKRGLPRQSASYIHDIPIPGDDPEA